MAKPLWFFMSYAHANDVDGGLVKAFYDKLCTYVGGRIGQPADSVGYLDKYELQWGQDWPSELRAALQRCRCFVPLMSPDYWKSRWCGAEWALFERRCATLKEPPPRLIAAVNWIAPFEAHHPEFATKLQFAPSQRELDPEVQQQLEARYAERGFSFFASRAELTKYRDSYTSVVEQLGDAILRLATQAPLPEDTSTSLPALSDLPSRFESERAERSSDTALSASRRAYFAVFAGRKLEMQAVRPKAAARYGLAEPDDWEPFAAERRAMALIAQQVASKLDLAHTPIRPIEGWLEQVRTAEDQHCPCVVVIDPWSAQLNGLKAQLQELDAALFRNCAVIVVWDLDAPGEAGQRAALEHNLHALLTRRRIGFSRTPLLCEDAGDPEALRKALSDALLEIETILAPLRPVLRPVATGTFAVRPGLSAA
jgi:FxsC-like protein